MPVGSPLRVVPVTLWMPELISVLSAVVHIIIQFLEFFTKVSRYWRWLNQCTIVYHKSQRLKYDVVIEASEQFAVAISHFMQCESARPVAVPVAEIVQSLLLQESSLLKCHLVVALPGQCRHGVAVQESSDPDGQSQSLHHDGRVCALKVLQYGQ